MTSKEKISILLVDDDSFLLDIYSVKFKEAGFEVNAATSGKKAVEMLKKDLKVNIILLDMIMPEITGLDILKTIKEEDLKKDTVIIVLSNQDPGETPEVYEFGADGYIVKATSTPSEVLEAVMGIYNDHKK